MSFFFFFFFDAGISERVGIEGPEDEIHGRQWEGGWCSIIMATIYQGCCLND